MLDVSVSLPADLTARLKSEIDGGLDDRSHILLQAYVPGVKVLRAPVAKPDILIEHRESSGKRFERRGDHLTLCDQWRGQIAFDLYHVLYAAERVKLLERGYYPIHAASSGNNEQVLLVGHSGSGKTRTAIELAERYGQKISSGNKTVVTFDEHHAMRVVAGTPTMTIRQTDYESYSSLAKEGVSYNHRVAFLVRPEQYVAPVRQRIRAIFLLRLHDGLHEKKDLDPRVALHPLYPYFLDTVNANVIVCGGYGVFVGTPPVGVPEKLAADLKEALEKVPVYSVAGPLPFVVDTIAKV